MRIAVLTNAYPPEARGGAGRIAFEYTKILEGLGHEVKVWGPTSDFRALAKMNPAARLSFHLADLKSRKDTAAEIAAWKPEVLMTHNLTGCGFATPREIQKRGVRWLHVLHDVQLFEPSGQMIFGEKHQSLKNFWRKVWGWLRRRSLGEPDVVISPTHWLAEQHGRYGFFNRAKLEILPNPVELGEVDGFQRDERAVLFVGRPDADKGIFLLIEAWTKMRTDAERLVIVGDSSRLPNLEYLHSVGVDVRGQLPSEQVRKVMAECGVLVVPSLVMENQPTVILEGLACGSKVVASDVGGVKETLGRAGWIFKPGSVEGLIGAVKDALAGEFDQEKRQAAQEVLKLHEPDAVASRLAGLLKSIL